MIIKEIERFEALVAELKAENFELKARLEKSIELPCKIGDKVYKIKCELGDKLSIVECIFDIGVWYYNQNNFDTMVFLTREEAEKALERKRG